MTTPTVTKFNFKTRTVKDDQGRELGKAKKQPSLEVALPFVTAEEAIEILSRSAQVSTNEKGEETVTEDKEKVLVLDAINSVIFDQARNQFDEVIDAIGLDDTKTVSVSDLDFDKLTLSYIATIPPKQRGARAIPEEDYQSFYQEYMPVMIQATGKPELKIKNHIDLFQKPTRIKQNKEALQALIDSLDIFVTATRNLEDHEEVVTRLRSKFSGWLKAEDKYDVGSL